MLTHQDVRAAATDLGLGTSRTVSSKRWCPCTASILCCTARTGSAARLTRGRGALAAHKRGVELTFIAQLDTSRIPPLPGADVETIQWLTHRAFVRLFADFHDHPFELNHIVGLIADPDVPRARVDEPDRPPSLEDTDEELILSAFTERAVDTVPGWRFDETHPAVAKAGDVDHGNMLENVPPVDLVHTGRPLRPEQEAKEGVPPQLARPARRDPGRPTL